MANAQFHPPKPPRAEKPVRDSLRYYSKQLGAMQREALQQARDSLKQTDAFKEVLGKYEQRLKRSRNYFSFIMFLEGVHTSYGDFNKSIEQSGFKPMFEMAPRLGFGFGFKKNWAIVDIIAVVGGFNTKTTKDEETIRASFSNLCQVNLGYDFLDTKWFSLYPYGGLSIKSSMLAYSKPEQLNGNPTNISNIIANNQSVSATATNLGYQAGLGFDLVVNNDNNTSASIFFVKLGTSGIFGKERFKIAGTKYTPGFKQGDWIITLGIKFAGRG
jgi:hypothetical protein